MEWTIELGPVTIELGPVAWILDYQLVSLTSTYEPSYTGLRLEPHWLA